MKTRHLPRTSGIYQIRNLLNGKVYVGSAVDLQKRAHYHKEGLRDGVHANAKLQRAWRKYGSDAFVFEVLEHVAEPACLIGREQFWIDRKACVSGGYNIAPRAGSNLGLKFSRESVEKGRRKKIKPIQGYITPDGAPLTVLDVRRFCEANGFALTGFYGLATGRVVSYKGWTHVNAKPKDRDWIKTYEGFIDPDGNPVPPITNLEQFCADRGLDASTMHRLYKGQKRMHHGWTHASFQPKPRRRVYEGGVTEGFIDPSGKLVTIQNLARFCRETGLDWSSMLKVKRGVLNHHKGWTHANSPPKPRKLQDEAIHHGFIDPQGNPVVIANMTAFCKANGLSLSAMARIRRGVYPSYKGWTYRPPAE